MLWIKKLSEFLCPHSNVKNRLTLFHRGWVSCNPKLHIIGCVSGEPVKLISQRSLKENIYYKFCSLLSACFQSDHILTNFKDLSVQILNSLYCKLNLAPKVKYKDILFELNLQCLFKNKLYRGKHLYTVFNTAARKLFGFRTYTWKKIENLRTFVHVDRISGYLLY